MALRSGDRVGLLSFGARVGAYLRPDKGRAQLGRLIEAAHDLQAEPGDSSFFRALAEVRLRQKKRALIVFLTDFVDREASKEMLDVLGILARKHAVLFVALYAATDEFHQSTVPNRQGSAWDVLLDTIGGLGGVVLLWIYWKFRNSRIPREANQQPATV